MHAHVWECVCASEPVSPLPQHHQYLGHLLGFPPRHSILIHERSTPEKHKFGAADLEATRHALATDYALYDVALARVQEQTALLDTASI